MQRMLVTTALVLTGSAAALAVVPMPAVDPVASTPPPDVGLADDTADHRGHRHHDAHEAHDGHDHGRSHEVSVHVRPSVAVRGADADEQARVDTALARFRDAGLLLPDLVVEFHDEQSACAGHDGLFQSRFVPFRVLICNGAEYVLTHELAHAWEAANLTDAERDAYLEYRGLATWDSPEHPRDARAVEDAAFTIQQNLMASHADPTSDRWIERTAAYAELTGRPSPLL